MELASQSPARVGAISQKLFNNPGSAPGFHLRRPTVHSSILFGQGSRIARLQTLSM
jgi:hypothetical protein